MAIPWACESSGTCPSISVKLDLLTILMSAQSFTCGSRRVERGFSLGRGLGGGKIRDLAGKESSESRIVPFLLSSMEKMWNTSTLVLAERNGERITVIYPISLSKKNIYICTVCLPDYAVYFISSILNFSPNLRLLTKTLPRRENRQHCSSVAVKYSPHIIWGSPCSQS